MTAFSSALSSQEAANTAAHNNHNQIVAYREYLYTISGVSEGTDPSEVLTKGQTEILEDFVTEARARDMPNAMPVDLRTRLTGRDAWKKQNQAFSSLELKVGMREIWSGLAYPIGSLVVESMAARPTVVVCEDGLLRVDRKPGLFTRSKALGYGVLPRDDPQYRTFVGVHGHINTGYSDLGRFAGELASLLAPKPGLKKSGFV